MTCPACNRPIEPGAYCAEGHPPRRAPRLTGAEKAEAQRLAQETQAKLKRQAWARREYRGVLEISAHRRWLQRRGELRAELAACIEAGILSEDDAHRLEAETADAVVEEAYARARREVEREAREDARGEAAPETEEPEPSRKFEPERRPVRHVGRGFRAAMAAMLLLGAVSPGRDDL